MKKSRRTTLLLTAAFAALMSFGTVANAQDQQAQVAKESVSIAPARVGVYDSRAIAVAYFGSDFFREDMQPLRAEYEKAKADGNEERVKEIDEMMHARQALAHRQGFGTAPVDDLLKHIESKLPEIANAAGVDVIVSKWAITYQTADANLTDITDQMVAPFNPSEKTLKTIKELRGKPPVPLEELDKMTGH